MTSHVVASPAHRALAWTLVASAVALGPLALLPDGPVWAGLAPADCLEYCEGSHRCGTPATRAAIQQPLNTVSNLAYLFVGLAVGLRRRDLAGGVFAAAMALLCAGSGLFHASMTRAGQWLDVVAMYVALNTLVGFALHAGGVASFARTLPAFLALDALLAAFKWSVPTIPILALQGGVLLAMLGRGARRGALPWANALAPSAIFLAGFAVRELDVRHVACDPVGWLWQGHAVWHGTSAFFLWGSFVALERVDPGR